MRLVIEGRPVPYLRMTQKEVAMATSGKGRKADRIQRYWAWKDEVGWEAKRAGVRPATGPVSLMVRVWATRPHGDVDNYLKGVADALNGIAYEDDRQVVEAHVKVYPVKRSEQRVEIEITAIEEESA